DKQDELRPIIVKKIKKGGGGHHGGAWKVAYADFVTAMMAFFLLLWLLNVTTKEQKAGIANFFDPTPKIATTVSGANGMLGGLTVSKDGAMATDLQQLAPRQEESPSMQNQDITDEQFEEETKKREEENFKKAEKAIQDAMKENPELQQLEKNLRMDMTPEGLRIQIVDSEGKPMFPSGSAQMYERTEKLIEKVAEVIRKMPNEISVRGHTDSVPYSKGNAYTNWELSADRANASRRVLVTAGVPDAKINNVLGKADKDHLVANKPNDAQNRRISIILLRQELVTQVGANRSTKAVQEQQRAYKDPLYRRSSGSVDFP
ncbi:MAG TPA: flagellar motor protein MotB, partial [Micavibrio sp.]|nr:flagellar motor protein MotB [Micavibrio sp.]